MSKRDAWRDGRVHVLAEQCSTCIFRPGNPMRLQPGRLRCMVREALERDSTIICHSTLGPSGNAICRGFFDAYDTTPLQLARRLNLIEFDPTPHRKA